MKRSIYYLTCLVLILVQNITFGQCDTDVYLSESTSTVTISCGDTQGEQNWIATLGGLDIHIQDPCGHGFDIHPITVQALGGCSTDGHSTLTFTVTDVVTGQQSIGVTTLVKVDYTAPHLNPQNIDDIHFTVDANDPLKDQKIQQWIDGLEANSNGTFSDGCSDIGAIDVQGSVDTLGQCGQTSYVTIAVTDACGAINTLEVTGSVTVTGNCLDISQDDISFTCKGPQQNSEFTQWLQNPICNTPTTITFTVVDVCGNSATTTAIAQVIDTISPVIQDTIGHPNLTVCDFSEIPPVNTIGVYGTDNCGNTLITVSHDTTATQVFRYYIAWDPCDN